MSTTSGSVTGKSVASNDVAPRPEGRRQRVGPDALWAKAVKRPEAGSLAGVLLVLIVFVAVAPPMRSLVAWSPVIYQASIIGIPAVGVALLMIGGEFDLTAGVAVTTSSLTASIFAMHVAGNAWAGVALALVLSLAVGALNGWLLIKTRLHSFLVTLSTFLMLQGINIALTRLITGGVATGDISSMPGFASAHAVFASYIRIGGFALNVSVLYWIVLSVLATWLLLRTRAGNWIFAVGGNGDAARAVGVPVARMKIALYMGVQACVWLLAMHLLFSFDTVQSGAGVGNELIYIAAAVVGGCLLTGGYGSAVGAALGALIFGIVTEGVIFAGWNSDWFKFFVGLMLLVATVANMWIRRRAVRGK